MASSSLVCPPVPSSVYSVPPRPRVELPPSGPCFCSAERATPCWCVEPLRRPLNPERDRRDDSGYRNVYRSHSDLKGWRAKVKLGGTLREIGRAALPHQAACIVVRWYRLRWGADWVNVGLKRRKSPKPWWLVYCENGRVCTPPEPGSVHDRVRRAGYWCTVRAQESPEDGGWLLWTYEWDREVCVRELPGGSIPKPVPRVAGRKPPGRVKVFASKEEAVAWVPVWLDARWGEGAGRAAQRV